MMYMQQLKAGAGATSNVSTWPMKENGGNGVGTNNDILLNRSSGGSAATNNSNSGSLIGSNSDGSNNAHSAICGIIQPCSGCRELKREVEDLRRMICQFLGTNRALSAGNLASENDSLAANPLNFINPSARNASSGNMVNQQQQSPPPPTPAIRHSAQCPSAALSFNNLANCNPQHLLPWLLTNGLLSVSNQPQIAPPPTPSAQSSASAALRLLEQMSPTVLEAALMGNVNNRASASSSSSLWQSLQQLNNVSEGGSSANNNRFADLVQAATALQQHQNNNNRGNNSNGNIGGSHHPESAQFVDPVGVDHASETSSSASSTNTQLLISPQQQLSASIHQQFGNCLNSSQRSAFEASHLAAAAAAVTRSNNFISAAAHLLSLPSNPGTESAAAALLHQHQNVLNGLPNGNQGIQQSVAPLQSNLALHASLLLQQQQHQQKAASQQALHQSQQQQFHKQQQQQTMRMQQQQYRKNSAPTTGIGNSSSVNNDSTIIDRNSTEKRRAASDDYVRIIRQQNLSEDNISKINIPVAQAFQVDPLFRPLSEQQVVQQVMQSKKYENVNVAETMAQLCKKLAEKRVFGSRLMSQTTVAAPNHSSYNNLPCQGIVYIQHVCRKVLGSRVKSDEEFWEYFREAMRKLAARCRRVRHAKKMRSPKVSVVQQQQQSQQQQQQLQLQQQQQLILEHHRQQQQQLQSSLPQFTNASANSFAPFGISGGVATPRDSIGSGDGEAMDVVEAESSSSPSPQTPMSSSTHHSTPTPTSVQLTDIKIESLGQE